MTEREIFDAALAIANPASRTAYLENACRGNAALLDHIAGLLEAHLKLGSFLELPGANVCPTIDQPSLEKPDTQIGPYKLLQQIGEGGMGVVYMAEQTEPVQRKVALKVIKPGMDSRQIIARFAAERQALAMMDHVNIARVLDAGATESGRPYFVMELVHGVPITKYCDDNRLTPRQRLELFLPVCQAIQHAHQKGVIHRDIKPSNVMVTLYDGKPVPKVIDFGVAKATEQKLTERTLFTQYGTMVGTLEYMSPEQAETSALGVDTRSDIYSLGVLLYELLTGSTPLSGKRMKEAAYAEILRMIKEEEPPKPSTRLSDSGEALASISAQRHTEPDKLSKLMRGELDWIVMKTLEKDRGRRYETASSFAADVQRYLDDEPVQACPPSAMYRFRKFARRNKGVFTGAALIFVVLLLGIVISTWQAIRAQLAQKDEAEQRTIANLRSIEADTQRGEAERQSQIARGETDRAAEAERTTRRHLYAAHMKLAEEAWERGQVAQVLEFLDRQRPQPNHDDLRSFEWYYLWGLCHRKDTLTLRAGQGPVLAVTFAPDGKTFATGAEDGAVRLWDPLTGQQRVALQAHTQGVCALAYFPGGETLASGSKDGTVRLWDLTTRRCLNVLEGHTKRVYSIAISRDGKVLATGSGDHTVKLWDMETKLPHLTLEIPGGQHSSGVWSVAFAPDGSTLATGSGDIFGEGQVQLWDPATGKKRAVLKGHQDAVHAVVFSPDGKTLAAGGFDTTIRLWDLAALQPKAVLRGHTSAVTALAFAPDGQTLVSTSADKTVKLWSVPAGQEQGTLKGHLGLVSSVVFAPDGKIIGTGSSDGTAKLWDPVQKHESTSLKAHNAEVRNLAFSSDSRQLATVSFSDNKVKLWDVATGQEQRTFGRDNIGYHAVAFSPGGKTLAAATGNDTVKLWDLITGRERSMPTAHAGGPWSLAFSPDGRLVATGGDDKTARLWDLASGQEQVVLNGHTSKVQYVAFSPGGKTLATASWDQTVKLWDVSTGKELATLKGHLNYVTSLAFSPDGKTLASGGAEGIAKLWDIATGRERFSLSGHTRSVWSVAFTSDGRTLATAAWDGTVKLWDPLTGQERLSLRADGQPFWSMAFSPDGKTLAAAGRHGVVSVWHAATKDEAENPSVWADRARASAALGQWDKAVAGFSKAIELRPDDWDSWNDRGLAYQHVAKWDEAIADFSKVIEANPKNLVTWSNRCLTYVRLRRWEKAIADYSKTLELAPDDAVLRNNFAWLLATCQEPKFRDPKRAVELAKKAVELDPKNATYPNTLGVALYRSAEWKAAIAALEKSLELRKGGDSFDWFFLAMAHWQLDEKEEARKWYDRAAAWIEKNKPQDEELKRFREEAAELLGLKEKKE